MGRGLIQKAPLGEFIYQGSHPEKARGQGQLRVQQGPLLQPQAQSGFPKWHQDTHPSYAKS